eukprot:scaffold221_cov189-Alexandrium_tamarense.AAC.5
MTKIVKSLIVAASAFAVSGVAVEEKNVKVKKLRGIRRQLGYGTDNIDTPSPTSMPTVGWGGSEPLNTEPPTGWGGGLEPVKQIKYTDDGWDDDNYSSVITANGSGSKSSKDSSTLNINEKSKSSSKVNANKSKGIDSAFNANGGKSGKGNFVGAASKSNGANFGPGKSKSKGGARPANPINPINPGSGWGDDAWEEPPAIEERAKWLDDGFTIVTPSPTEWKGDSHPLITPEPSPSPTACEERMLWHPNPDYTMCTNDSNFPDNEKYIYASLVKCCKDVFGTLSCEYDDVCSTPSPSKAPVEPLATPEPSPSPTACEERMLWHPNPDYTMCTNDSNFPDNEKYIYASLVKCCEDVFGTLSCEYDDICSSPQPSKAPVTPQPTIVTPQPTPSPTSCEERMLWHPSADGSMCTNDANYPTDDNDFHNSLQECCKAVFGTLVCEYDDICTSSQPSKAPVTPQPSSPAPTTDAPVSPLPTMSPLSAVTTAPPTTPRPSFFPTASPSFGSTPTVSKETTGPPTMSGGRTRSMPRGGAFKKDVATECREVRGGTPVVCNVASPPTAAPTWLEAAWVVDTNTPTGVWRHDGYEAPIPSWRHDGFNNIVGGKSGKGVSLEFSGGKSGKNGVNFNANKSKGIDSDFNTNVGKSGKGNFVGAASKSKGANFGPGKSKSKGGQDLGWSDDAWKEPPNVEERYWNDDGWTPPPVLTDAPASWAGDSYPPTRKPVTPLIAPDPSPSPSACEERMRWHPNSDYTICTNDSSFPTNGEEYVYPSLVKRCKAVFGTLACEYNDICTTNEPTTSPLEPFATPQPSPSPTSCEERMLWHPNSDYTMSTNDSNFPDKEEYI